VSEKHTRVEGGILIDPRPAAERGAATRQERDDELLNPNLVAVTPGWQPDTGLPRVRLEVHGESWGMPAEWAIQLGLNLITAAHEAITDASFYLYAIGKGGSEPAAAGGMLLELRALRNRLAGQGQAEAMTLADQLAAAGQDSTPEAAGGPGQ
jgi:hypothetical protein